MQTKETTTGRIKEKPHHLPALARSQAFSSITIDITMEPSAHQKSGGIKGEEETRACASHAYRVLDLRKLLITNARDAHQVFCGSKKAVFLTVGDNRLSRRWANPIQRLKLF